MSDGDVIPLIQFPDPPSSGEGGSKAARKADAREFAFALDRSAAKRRNFDSDDARSKRKSLPKRRSAVDTALLSLKVATKSSAKSANSTKKVAQKAITQAAHPGDIRKPHRFRPGTVALREIRKFQRGADRLVPNRPLDRLIREIAQDCIHDWVLYKDSKEEGMRFRPDAITALHVAAESFVVDFFQKVNLHAVCAGRQTIMSKDVFYVLESDEKLRDLMRANIPSELYATIQRKIKDKMLTEEDVRRVFGTTSTTKRG